MQAGRNATEGEGGQDAASYSHSTTGAKGQSTGTQQMSALPGHGTGQPAGQVTEGTATTHPIGKNRGADGASATGATTAHNTHVGGGSNTGYGTGGTYS